MFAKKRFVRAIATITIAGSEGAASTAQIVKKLSVETKSEKQEKFCTIKWQKQLKNPKTINFYLITIWTPEQHQQTQKL